ncbi:timeless protein [Necator americanus]|uniref:Timeless protein n=1 Tax=Necator americanus TaxID=51031 RepID=W2T5S3_NECAM|nr:timeless protein [Necator americanus]ETN77360.1 timeless protein [Necator americanus]
MRRIHRESSSRRENWAVQTTLLLDLILLISSLYIELLFQKTIRDLIRFLRNDSNTLLARKICGERNIIANDLIPIIKSENLKEKMFDITLRLLANLIQPAIVSLQGKQPEDREEWQTYWLLEGNLRRAKLAFADVKFFQVLKGKVEKYFLETDWEDRLEEDRLVMERIIVLLRYIFAIPPTDRDGKVLIHIASQSVERDFHLSVLVIFALIVKEHNAEDIVAAGRDKTAAEREKAEEELRRIVEVEQMRLNAQRRKVLASRHSRFSGSYIVKGVSAVNKEKDLVVVKPIKDVNDLNFLDERKVKKRVAKNRSHQHLLSNGSTEEKELSQRICDHILVVEEYREMGLMLMRKFMPGVFSKSFLRDLVLSMHYYFRLLEKRVKSGELTTVKKRSKVRRRPTKNSKHAELFGPEPLPAVVDSLNGEELEKKWSHISEELNEIVFGHKEASSDQIPINSLLDVDEELHQKFAMLKVQRAMREGRPSDAVGLYKASRAMWLSDGKRIFGDVDMDGEKMVAEFREIFFTDLKQVADQLLTAELEAQKRFTANSLIDGGDVEDMYSDEDEEDEPKYETKEVSVYSIN